MKILHVIPYIPAPPNFGGALRIWHLLKHFSAYHDVTVAGYCELGNLEYFKKSFPSLEGKMHLLNRKKAHYHRLVQFTTLFTPHSYWYNWAQSDEFQNLLNRILAGGDFDFVVFEFSAMGHFSLQTNAVRIVDAHNVEFENFRRMSQLSWSPVRKVFYKREFEKSRKEEIEIFRKQNAIFSTSEVDAGIIKKHAPEIPNFVIPNGVETAYFQPFGSMIEPYSMVFTGSMSYVPNHDGMYWFLEEVFPKIKKRIPEAVIYIVGNNPPPMLKKLQSESVIITGFVDDVRPFIDKAQVYVVPLRMGSGTRLKILEALSMKKPIVSTSIGSEGIEVENESHLLIRDDTDAFAEAVIQLMNDVVTCNRLVSNGYDLVMQKYDWNIIGHSVDEALKSLKSPKLEPA